MLFLLSIKASMSDVALFIIPSIASAADAIMLSFDSNARLSSTHQVENFNAEKDIKHLHYSKSTQCIK